MRLLIALALATLALGCAPKTQPAAMPCSPPVVWLQDVPEPSLEGDTNKDLVEWIVSLQEALRRCNLDKAGLREWAR